MATSSTHTISSTLNIDINKFIGNITLVIKTRLTINALLYRSSSDTPPVDWWQSQCHFSRLYSQQIYICQTRCTPTLTSHYMDSADAAVSFSQLTATSSALLSLIRPPSSFVNWHKSTWQVVMCTYSDSLITWHYLQVFWSVDWVTVTLLTVMSSTSKLLNNGT